MSKCATRPVSLRHDEQMRQGIEHQPVKHQRKFRLNNSELRKGLVMDTDPRKIFDNVISISMTLGKGPRKLGENTQITNYWNTCCSCRFYHGFEGFLSVRKNHWWNIWKWIGLSFFNYYFELQQFFVEFLGRPDARVLGGCTYTGWWFHRFLMFTPICGRGTHFG